ncbi:MAG: acetolactate synthase small subunit [Bacteroidaceae bacterium]|jgi:acetolactate synthase-1/3 small subunit|nr:acetolactate synthase small subunit [Bacteroidaceae bacterium]
MPNQNNDCQTCGKCDNTAREKNSSKNGLPLHTIIVYSENISGLLSQITAVFTRRQVNIETLNVCASSTPGVHKYTITCFCDTEMAEMLKKQMEKRIDVLQANYFTDDQIYIQETALFKLSTPAVLQNNRISKVIRIHDAKIVEVNPTYSIVEKTGLTEEILSLFDSLTELECILQFVRSGRIAVTKSTIEKLDEYIRLREKKHAQIMEQ